MAEKIHKPSLAGSIINLVLGFLLAFLVSWLLAWLVLLVARIIVPDLSQTIYLWVKRVLMLVSSSIFLIAVIKDFTEQNRAYNLTIARRRNG